MNSEGSLRPHRELCITWLTPCSHADFCRRGSPPLFPPFHIINKYYPEPTGKQTLFYRLGYINGEDENKSPFLVGLTFQQGQTVNSSLN